MKNNFPRVRKSPTPYNDPDIAGYRWRMAGCQLRSRECSSTPAVSQRLRGRRSAGGDPPHRGLAARWLQSAAISLGRATSGEEWMVGEGFRARSMKTFANAGVSTSGDEFQFIELGGVQYSA